MALPGSYTNSIPSNPAEEVDLTQFINKLEIQLNKNEMVKEFTTAGETVQFNYISFLGIHYQIEIRKPGIESKTIEYEIKLNKLIMICIALVIFIAFFSSFKFSSFLWFSLLFTLIFYVINIIVVDRQVQTLLKSVICYGAMSEGMEEILTQEQLEWIKDQSKCPACGEGITEYDKNCPECGLKINEVAKLKPYDLSKYGNKHIKYFFREKKKDKHD
jgi:hypothetical protein